MQSNSVTKIGKALDYISKPLVIAGLSVTMGVGTFLAFNPTDQQITDVLKKETEKFETEVAQLKLSDNDTIYKYTHRTNEEFSQLTNYKTGQVLRTDDNEEYVKNSYMTVADVRQQLEDINPRKDLAVSSLLLAMAAGIALCTVAEARKFWKKEILAN